MSCWCDENRSLLQSECHHRPVGRSRKVVLDDMSRVVAGGTKDVGEPAREVLVDEEPHAVSR